MLLMPSNFTEKNVAMLNNFTEKILQCHQLHRKNVGCCNAQQFHRKVLQCSAISWKKMCCNVRSIHRKFAENAILIKKCCNAQQFHRKNVAMLNNFTEKCAAMYDQSIEKCAENAMQCSTMTSKN